MNIELETMPSGLLFSEIEEEKPTVSTWFLYWGLMDLLAALQGGLWSYLVSGWSGVIVAAIGGMTVAVWFITNFDSHTGHMRMKRVL